MEKKKYSFEIQLCSINQSDNPAKKPVEFILHDFDISYNNTRIKKEVCKKALPTLKGMPIVCRYYPVSEIGADDDALSGHEAHLDINRNGELTLTTDAIAIGVFTEDAFIETVTDSEGNEKEVAKGKGILWSSRYPDIVDLLQEWWDNEIPIKSSMEILYDEYHVKDGIEDIDNYIYEGHCILNSQKRGEHEIVLPAYDLSRISKFQRLVAEAIKRDSNEEGGKIELFKKILELSHDDVRYSLYTELSKNLSEEEYRGAWIYDVFDTYFIYESWVENEGTKYYQVNYTKNDNSVTIDMNSKIEVIEERKWIQVAEVQNLQAELEKANKQLEDTNKQLNEVNTELTTIKTEKENVNEQFNNATEKLVSLNEQIKELKPFKEQYEKEQYEKALEEKRDFYSEKFNALNAKEKFESEEIQELIVKAVNDKEAVLQLNSILVDLVEDKKGQNNDNKIIKEFASKQEDLIPTNLDFDSRYRI